MSNLRWLILYYGHYWEGGDLYVFTTTDIPCHCYLRWTDKEEHVHLRSKTDRGLTKLSDPDYCFVEWNEIEQIEAGDTLEHSFIIPGWEQCITRWWHFRATIEGKYTPSNTCIFRAHAFDQEEAFTMKHTDLSEKEVAGVIDHADGSVTPAKLTSPFTFSAFPYTPGEAPSQDYQVANKKYIDDLVGPTGMIWHDPCTRVLFLPNISETIGWTDLDLSGWVPAGSKFAYLNLYIKTNNINATGRCLFTVRKKDTDPDHSPRCIVHYDNGNRPGGYMEVDVWVPLDDSYRFQWYAAVAAVCNIDLAIHLNASSY